MLLLWVEHAEEPKLDTLAHAGSWRNRLSDEAVATDDGATTDDCVAAQDGGVGVDDDVIFQSWMSLFLRLFSRCSRR